MVVLGDETFEFAPTGNPFSCFVDTNSGVVMATFEGLTDAGDELYVDYDSDLGDPVAANLSTVDPVAAWFFGTGIAGTEVTQTDITSGDGTFSVSGEMTSSRPDVDPRAATVTLECS
jgi:hypothetical protein